MTDPSAWWSDYLQSPSFDAGGGAGTGPIGYPLSGDADAYRSLGPSGPVQPAALPYAPPNYEDQQSSTDPWLDYIQTTPVIPSAPMPGDEAQLYGQTQGGAPMPSNSMEMNPWPADAYLQQASLDQPPEYAWWGRP